MTSIPIYESLSKMICSRLRALASDKASRAALASSTMGLPVEFRCLGSINLLAD
jgi:hypothetical protein